MIMLIRIINIFITIVVVIAIDIVIVVIIIPLEEVHDDGAVAGQVLPPRLRRVPLLGATQS